ncbi:substrate-binding domain-containing protein [Microbacterium sp. E-13]|uniref:substrate-binding domain-containing protein n=1 Tax=Microbacterium sp. E-13 TaxID=3404048 RepID=UPI003CF95192
MIDTRTPDTPERWAVGMALVRPSRDLQAESYSQELIAGLDEAVARAGGSFLVKIVPDEASERATYEQWAKDGRIHSVVIEEFTVSDTRRALLEELGFGITVLGDVDLAGDHSAIWNDHAAAVDLAMRSLYDLGHRAIARVSGPDHFQHSRVRSAAFFEVGAALGIHVQEALGDYSRRSGARATRELLASAPPPTAIVYDNDLMALGGLEVIEAEGLRVPEDVSVVAWDDSVRCQMSIPPLAALSHDVREIGRSAGEAAARERAGEIVREESPRPVFLTRGSVAPPSA